MCKSVCMFEQLCKPAAAADNCSDGFDLSTLPMTPPCPPVCPRAIVFCLFYECQLQPWMSPCHCQASSSSFYIHPESPSQLILCSHFLILSIQSYLQLPAFSCWRKPPPPGSSAALQTWALSSHIDWFTIGSIAIRPSATVCIPVYNHVLSSAFTFRAHPSQMGAIQGRKSVVERGSGTYDRWSIQLEETA